MKFTLVYDGPLPPTANNSRNSGERKWTIRKKFDPQLRQLWAARHDLIHLRDNSIVSKDGKYIWAQSHPLHPELEVATRPMRPFHAETDINLCEPIHKQSRTFFPLVRKPLALTCGLKVLFLRNEPRGRVFQGGDLDNRIKTLVDALAVPVEDTRYDDPSLIDPVFCLLEDDALVSAFDVRSERLLSPTGTQDTEVRLVIEVDVRISSPRGFNVMFGGD